MEVTQGCSEPENAMPKSVPATEPNPSRGRAPAAPNQPLGPNSPGNAEVRPPSLPAETFGEGSGFEDLGSVSPEEAENSAGSID